MAAEPPRAEPHVSPIPDWAADAAVPWVLRNAARDGLVEVVESQLKLGCPVNSPDVNGHTALLLAAEAGHLEVVQALLSASADTETKTKAGLTPYLASCMHDHAAVGEALLLGGAQADAVDVSPSRPPLPTSPSFLRLTHNLAVWNVRDPSAAAAAVAAAEMALQCDEAGRGARLRASG